MYLFCAVFEIVSVVSHNTLKASHLGIIYHACAILVNVNVHAKFEVPSFIQSKDMTGAQNLKMSHVTLTVPLWGNFSSKGNTWYYLPVYKNLTTVPEIWLWGLQNFKWVMRPWPLPFQGWVVVRLALATVSLPIRNVKSLSPTIIWRYERRRKMQKLWFVVFRGHSRLLQMAPFDRAHTRSYQPFTVAMSLSCTVSEI